MTTTPFPPLPASFPADFARDVTVLVDTREQTPLTAWTLPYSRETIKTGDYSVRCGDVALTDHYIVERKTLDDLAACCKSGTKKNPGERERLEREFGRMQEAQSAILAGECGPMRSFLHALLIIGTAQHIEMGYYHSRIEPRSVKASIKAWRVRYSVEIVYAPNPIFAAAWVELWGAWVAREWKLAAKRGTKANGLARGSVGEVGKEEEGEP